MDLRTNGSALHDGVDTSIKGDRALNFADRVIAIEHILTARFVLFCRSANNATDYPPGVRDYL